MIVVPVVIDRRSLVPRLRGVQTKQAADGARRRARRAHARRRHPVVVVRARRWLLPYARGRSVLCCYYATRLFMVWARYQCVGGPRASLNNGPQGCPRRCRRLYGSPLGQQIADCGGAICLGGSASPRTRSESAHGSRDLSSKLRMERVERTSGSGDVEGDRRGETADAGRRPLVPAP